MDKLNLSALNPAQRARTIEWLLAMLTHTVGCDRTTCGIRLCDYVGNLVEHARACRRREVEHCPKCWYYILLCRQHTESCALQRCTLPFCNEIKRRRQQKILEQTQQPTECVKSQQKAWQPIKEKQPLIHMAQVLRNLTAANIISPVIERADTAVELPILHMSNSKPAGNLNAGFSQQCTKSSANSVAANLQLPATDVSNIEMGCMDYSLRKTYTGTVASNNVDETTALEAFYELNANLCDSDAMVEVASTDYQVFTPDSSMYNTLQMFNEVVGETPQSADWPMNTEHQSHSFVSKKAEISCESVKIYRENGVVSAFDDCAIEDDGTVSPVNEVWQSAYLDWNKMRDKNRINLKLSVN